MIAIPATASCDACGIRAPLQIMVGRGAPESGIQIPQAWVLIDGAPLAAFAAGEGAGMEHIFAVPAEDLAGRQSVGVLLDHAGFKFCITCGAMPADREAFKREWQAALEKISAMAPAAREAIVNQSPLRDRAVDILDACAAKRMRMERMA